MTTLLRALTDVELLPRTVAATLEGDDVRVRDGKSELSLMRNPFTGCRRDPSRYTVVFCYTGQVGERQHSAITLRGVDQSTIGHLFPVASLRTGEHIEQEWPRRYAWVAVNALFHHDNPRVLARGASSDILRLKQELLLDDIFSDEISIAVFGDANLARHGVPPVAAGFLVRQCGGVALRGDDGRRQVLVPREWQGVLSVRPPALCVHDELGALDSMLDAVDGESSRVGLFMTLYQFIEYAISRVFDWCINNVRTEELTSWELKARLQKIPNEKWRLSTLNGFCLRHANHQTMEVLKSDCVEFLNSLAIKNTEKLTWWQALYKVRNLIVHNQIAIIHKDYLNLTAINISLVVVAHELLCSLEQPDFEEIWKVDALMEDLIPGAD